ncbi:putative polyamine transporter [Capsicum annuum]|uniref:Polyamine transporter n=1 Tax=Capsicum annuum TaxID=4072 RepID=A0A2G3AIZ2_CAPAN|nr:putative polyamine transporter [Capsicum annuum]
MIEERQASVSMMTENSEQLPMSTTTTSTKKSKKLSLIPLIFLIYFELVAGGTHGEEPAVQAAGPLLAILGFLVFPFIWSVPEAMITAELSTTFPGNGGFIVWADRAFAPFWGSLMGTWKFLSGVINIASFPVLCIIDQREWETGFMANAAEMISGKWLKIWIEIGAVLSAIGLFESKLSSCSFQLLGMADLAFLPKFFGLTSKWFDTPWGDAGGDVVRLFHSKPFKNCQQETSNLSEFALEVDVVSTQAKVIPKKKKIVMSWGNTSDGA